MEIRQFRIADEAATIDLWNRCGLLRPWNNPQKDIQRKLSVQPEMFLLGVQGDKIIASVMAGYDGHRGWIYYLAVDPAFQKHGFGRKIMDEAEKLLRKMGCPKINLMIRESNIKAKDFYQSIGYSKDEVVSFGKRLDSDEV